MLGTCQFLIAGSRVQRLAIWLKPLRTLVFSCCGLLRAVSRRLERSRYKIVHSIELAATRGFRRSGVVISIAASPTVARGARC